MRSALLLSLLVCGARFAAAQTATVRPDALPIEDPKLRAEAVSLMERANHVSSPAVWGSNELTLHFHVPNPAAGQPNDGDYVSDVAAPGLRRQEWHYGAYQLIQIRNGPRIAGLNNNVPKPLVVDWLPRLTPIYLARFDHEDIIRSITDGPNDSRCIHFETVFGDSLQDGEVCVDSKNGWLLSIRQGDVTTLNSNFFPFAGAFLPGHIERSVGGVTLISIEQTVASKDFPAELFVVPETSTASICREFRGVYAINTPQPEPGSSPEITDVTLRGLIDSDGRVKNLESLDPTRPELSAQAIKQVSTWTFTPATCDGKAVAWETQFVVHFKGATPH
jgi:Gram-negative bacterial TonB protein C-terminal